MDDYDEAETPAEAVQKVREFWGDPPLTAETVAALTSFATTCLPTSMSGWQRHTYRAIRQNALRVLVATSPDLQCS